MDRRKFLIEALEASTVMVGALVLPNPIVAVPEERKVVIAHRIAEAQERRHPPETVHRILLTPDRSEWRMPVQDLGMVTLLASAAWPKDGGRGGVEGRREVRLEVVIARRFADVASEQKQAFAATAEFRNERLVGSDWKE